eukprot:gene672-472_t
MYRRLTCRPNSTLQRLSALSRRQRFSSNGSPSNDITQQLPQKVFEDFKKLEIAKNAVILLGVSGGCDSVAMLHLLQNIRENHVPELDLKVVNYNHKTRPETDTEATFVEGLARQYNMEYFPRVWPEEHKDAKFSQDLARSWRLAESKKIIQSITEQTPDREVYMATAHHLEDQIETTLVRLIRGPHISNLQGMVPKSEFQLKPLLNLHKKDLQEYLKARNLMWYDDSSNDTRDYLRNKVRLDLVPLLGSLAGGEASLQKSLLSLAKQSAEVDKFVAQEAKDVASRLASVSYEDYHALFFKTGEDKSSGKDLALTQNPFASLSPLVLQHIVRDWVLKKTGIILNQVNFDELLPFFDEKHRLISFRTISGKWDLGRYKNEIRLVLRRNPFGAEKKNVAELVGPLPRRSTSWTSTVYAAQRFVDNLPQMVEFVHPTFINVSVMSDKELHQLPEFKSSKAGNAIETTWKSLVRFHVPLLHVPGRFRLLTDEHGDLHEPIENASEEFLHEYEAFKNALNHELCLTIAPLNPLNPNNMLFAGFGKRMEVRKLTTLLNELRPGANYNYHRLLVATIRLSALTKIRTRETAVTPFIGKTNTAPTECTAAVIFPDGVVVYTQAYTDLLRASGMVSWTIGLNLSVSPLPELVASTRPPQK